MYVKIAKMTNTVYWNSKRTANDDFKSFFIKKLIFLVNKDASSKVKDIYDVIKHFYFK